MLKRDGNSSKAVKEPSEITYDLLEGIRERPVKSIAPKPVLKGIGRLETKLTAIP